MCSGHCMSTLDWTLCHCTLLILLLGPNFQLLDLWLLYNIFSQSLFFISKRPVHENSLCCGRWSPVLCCCRWENCRVAGRSLESSEGSWSSCGTLKEVLGRSQCSSSFWEDCKFDCCQGLVIYGFWWLWGAYNFYVHFQYNATISQDRQSDAWADKSLLHNTSQTGMASEYSLPPKRESLYLDRETQIEHSGLPLYGQEHGLSGIRSSGLGRSGAPIVTQVEIILVKLLFIN